MEYLTLGQVIDTMKLDEVAVVVNDNVEDIQDYLSTINHSRYVAMALYFGEDRTLRDVSSACRVILTYTGEELATKHVILKREVYERMINK